MRNVKQVKEDEINGDRVNLGGWEGLNDIIREHWLFTPHLSEFVLRLGNCSLTPPRGVILQFITCNTKGWGWGGWKVNISGIEVQPPTRWSLTPHHWSSTPRRPKWGVNSKCRSWILTPPPLLDFQVLAWVGGWSATGGDPTKVGGDTSIFPTMPHYNTNSTWLFSLLLV